MKLDRFETNFVDLAGAGRLLGQANGRKGISVIDCATYRSAVRRALPNARVVADHFHLVLANEALTQVRQRTTRDLLGGRGTAADPLWCNRRRLLRARERLSGKAFTRMWNELIHHDPTADILAAWIAKEELRALLATARRGGQRHDWVSPRSVETSP